jgi:hypothetical protein
VNGRYLIVNADDVGLAPEVDAGILETIRACAVTSISMFVNPPHATDLAPFRAMGVSIGLHANLTQGRPCAPASRVASLVDAHGRFFSDGCERLATFRLAEIAAEIEAQLARFVEIVGAGPTHIDFHKHLHAYDARVLSLGIDVVRALGVPLRAVDDAMRARCREAGVAVTDHFLGGVRPPPYWTCERVCTAIEEVSIGITELVCHPAKGMRPVPGLWYCAERDVEREALTCEAAARCFAKATLVNFANAPFARGATA